MIKEIVKKFLPMSVQNQIRNYLMLKHKRNIETMEEFNKREQYLRDFSIIKDREAVYKSSNINFDTVQKDVLNQMSRVGYFFDNLSKFHNKHQELISYLDKMAQEVRDKSYEEIEKEHTAKDFTHAYGRKAHFVNLYHPKKGVSDPIKDFMTNPYVFTMAARYLGEIPQVMMCSFLYTAPNTLDERGPMLWHLDRHHDSVFRMFINPYEMTKENGATMTFPNKYTEEYYKKYPYFNNREAIEAGFDMDDIVTLEGSVGKFGIVDTCKNFHCGSRSKKERFLAILTFVPYVHKDKYDALNVKEEIDVYEKENQFIYDYFKNS